MPNFVSPTLPFDQILASFLEEEERKAREKREAEENAKRERIENAIKEEKRKNLAALGYHEEDFPSHFEDGGNALEAPSGLTPNFASPSKDLGALIEKEEIKPVEETKPLAKEGVPTEVVAPSARIEGPIGGEGTGTPVPVPYQEAPSAKEEIMAHALLTPNGPTPDFESPYKDLRNVVAMADLPPFEEQQPEEIQEDNLPIEESVEEEKSGFTGITRLSFAEKLAKADEELYRMYQEIHDHILLSLKWQSRRPCFSNHQLVIHTAQLIMILLRKHLESLRKKCLLAYRPAMVAAPKVAHSPVSASNHNEHVFSIPEQRGRMDQSGCWEYQPLPWMIVSNGCPRDLAGRTAVVLLHVFQNGLFGIACIGKHLCRLRGQCHHCSHIEASMPKAAETSQGSTDTGCGDLVMLTWPE